MVQGHLFSARHSNFVLKLELTHFLMASSMSFITKESKCLINDVDNKFIFTAYWWAVGLTGVTAVLCFSYV